MAEANVRSVRRGPASHRRDEVVIEEVGDGERPAGQPPSARPSCSFTFCPICTALTLVAEARPELLDHVLVAGREALLALRALIDSRVEGAPSRQSSKLERLTID